MKTYLILGICRTWRCENVMSCWQWPNGKTIDSWTVPASWSFFFHTHSVDDVLWLTLFDLFYRFGATSAICDNIHGRRNQCTIFNEAPNAGNARHVPRNRCSRCRRQQCVKMNKRQRRLFHVKTVYFIRIHDDHPKSHIDENGQRQKSTPALIPTIPMPNKPEKWIEIMQRNEMCWVSFIFSLWHLFCLPLWSKIEWILNFSLFFPRLVAAFFPIELLSTLSIETKHSICVRIHGKSKQLTLKRLKWVEFSENYLATFFFSRLFSDENTR